MCIYLQIKQHCCEVWKGACTVILHGLQSFIVYVLYHLNKHIEPLVDRWKDASLTATCTV